MGIKLKVLKIFKVEKSFSSLLPRVLKFYLKKKVKKITKRFKNWHLTKKCLKKTYTLKYICICSTAIFFKFLFKRIAMINELLQYGYQTKEA